MWPKDGLTAEIAQDRLRDSFTDTVSAYMNKSILKNSVKNQVKNSIKNSLKIIDIGCSVGVSTFYLAKKFIDASVIDGFDLSPYFLAVARQRQVLTSVFDDDYEIKNRRDVSCNDSNKYDSSSSSGSSGVAGDNSADKSVWADLKRCVA